MQIRKLDLKELQTAWEVVSQLRTNIEYKEFEDLVYDMRESNYTMVGIFEKSKLVTYAGVTISTNLYHKRHLFIHEFVTIMQRLVRVKTLFSLVACKEKKHIFNEFIKASYVFVKAL